MINIISIVNIDEEDIASAWIKAVKEVYLKGDDIHTQWDKENDPPAKDSTALITVRKPFSNPMRVGSKNRILKLKSKYGNKWIVYGHKGDIILANEIISGYIEMVLYGDEKYRESESYSYDYNDRITNWKPYEKRDIKYKKYKIKIEGENKNLNEIVFPSINQLDNIVKKLKESPISRRVQAITWKPLVDPYNPESPCLQRLWFRIKNNKLICQSSWRSRDLWSAWQSNVNAIIRIQEYVADRLNVKCGEYIDFSNSLHIYGKDIKKVKEFLENERLI